MNEPEKSPPTPLLPRGEQAWLKVLREQCVNTSQAAVARRLGVSPALINQTLKGVYQGNMARVQALVEGEYLGRTVMCPVLDELPANRCMEYQSRPFAATNPLRVKLFRACRACPHNKQREEL